MKSDPLVSVIIPVYNTRKEYLIKCIESVEQQDYKELEVIIVNDGSDKSTSGFLDKFVLQASNDPDRHKWRIIHQKNKGLSAARNSGYRIATGKYIQFLDSDDFFDSRLIAATVNKAEKTNAQIVIQNFIVDDYSTGIKQPILNANTFPSKNGIFKLSDLRVRRFEAIPYSVWSKMFRKDFLDKNKLLHNEKLFRAEDVLFSYTALVLAKRIALLPYPYITYRENLPGSNTKTNDKFPTASIEAWRCLHSVLEKYSMYSLYKKDFEESMLGSISWHLNKLHTAKGKKELAASAQEFMAEIGSSTANDYSMTIAVAAVNPELLPLVNDKNRQIQLLRSRENSLETQLLDAKAELERLRKPSIKLASRKLAGAVKRKLQHAVSVNKERTAK